VSLRPEDHASAADWFVDAAASWWVKATYGPPGYESYARVMFDLTAAQADSDARLMSTVLDILVPHTSTPQLVYVGVWEGWGHSIPAGARFGIRAGSYPERVYALLSGPVTSALDPASLGLTPGHTATPHLVWPADRAWFVASDVDPDWFTVAGSGAAIRDLLAAPGVDTAPVEHPG
jgi:hypothetical protein